jgi:hypothetical protein
MDCERYHFTWEAAMGLFSKKTPDFAPDYKDRYLEFDSRKKTMRLKLSRMKSVIFTQAELKGYQLLQDDIVIFNADGKRLGLTKDNTLPPITQTNEPTEEEPEKPDEFYTFELVVRTTTGDHHLKFINTRTPVKSPAYSDAILDAENVLVRLDPVLPE